MLVYKTAVLLLLYTTNIEGEESLKFRFDYTFSEEADVWLKFHQVPDKWNDANDRCQFEGAVLASPLTPIIQKAILKHVTNVSSNVDAIFTGVHATFSPGDYASVEGSPLLQMAIAWAPGEPNNLDNSESCLAMMPRQNGIMKDVKCNDPLPYVCYKKRTELKMTECGTHDKEYKMERTGNCYKLHKRGLSWPKAYTACAAEGGYLAVMNSQDESLLLREIFAKVQENEIFAKDTGSCHVGLYDLRDGGLWMTVHGQSMTEAGYDQWGSGQPDNNTSFGPEGEACGSIFRDGRYNDVWCGLHLAFICEKVPNSLD